MDEKRTYLKELASRSADRWSAAPPSPAFAGETCVETRNTLYRLRDGVCVGVTRRGDEPARTDPSDFVGMRAVGWLSPDHPHGGPTQEWRPGAYAVLWRPRRGGERHSAVALTSASLVFRALPRPARAAAPPPLPTARKLAPPSMARVMEVPRPADTPTPVRSPRGVPPLPPRRPSLLPAPLSR